MVEQNDDLGVCLVAQFRVNGTLVMFYQSALATKDQWIVFVDMPGCVAKGMLPTHLGKSVLKNLTEDSIVPEWVNSEADTEYRSRRRKPLHNAEAAAAIPVILRAKKPRVKPLSLASDTIRAHRGKAHVSEMFMLKGTGTGTNTNTGAERSLSAKKAAMSRKAAAEKPPAPAKKVVTHKNTATAKKSVVKGAAASRK